jgi:hypothetical protein
VRPPPDEGFRPAWRALAQAEARAPAQLCREHHHQTNEVNRCRHVVAAVTAGDPRPIAPIDLGIGAVSDRDSGRRSPHCSLRRP